MPLTDMIRRASTYILGGDDDVDGNNLDFVDNAKTLTKMTSHYEDNEVLFCKNNVCVHPPAIVRHDSDIHHNPGYLTITTKIFVDQYNDSKRPTLFLTWIPNVALTRCPQSQQGSTTTSPAHNFFNYQHRKSPLLTKQQTSTESLTASSDSCSELTSSKNTNPFLNQLNHDGNDDDSDADDDKNDLIDNDNGIIININVDIANPDIEIVTTPSSDDKKKFDCFSRSESLMTTTTTSSGSGGADDNTSHMTYNNWMLMSTTTTPEFLAQKHNLMFPDSISNCSANSSPILSTRQQQHEETTINNKCRRFSVDLSQMRSLRLFFNDNSCTCGQLVVASRESQYKILHFHYGGLDHLAQVLHQWHSLLHNIKHAKGDSNNDESLPYRHFMVCRPEVSNLELHPEEGHVTKLTAAIFHTLFNETGQLEDDITLRKSIFFAGMDRDLRKEVWPFLLHVYPYQSTYAERAQIADVRRQEYEEITRRRLDLTGSQLNLFRRKVQSVVEKDVVRTDRGNPFFAGDSNPNLDMMKNILLNYAIYNPSLGYTQGMSDLLAPVLCELNDQVAAFWCFVGLMQRAVFVATPTDHDMDRSLRYLRELVRIMVPRFDQHLAKHRDAAELLFCHRWILLCFKREFTEAVALRMWEACWANYLTDYFHLFLCLAIICVYADDVIAQDLRADEMLLHFSSLAMYMDGLVIARKARGLLHQFRQLREIPCTLYGLCTRCGPGIWDSAHSPRIYCVGGHDVQGHCNNSILN